MRARVLSRYLPVTSNGQESITSINTEKLIPCQDEWNPSLIKLETKCVTDMHVIK